VLACPNVVEPPFDEEFWTLEANFADLVFDHPGDLDEIFFEIKHQ